MADPDPPGFDAIAAAKELDDLLGDSAPTGTTTAENQEYIANLETEIEQLTEALGKAEQRAERAEAEIEAATRRIENASAKDLEHKTRKVLESFLPVLDDLGRAVDAARQHVDSKDVVDGLELVRRSVLTRLGQFGVTHAPALGEVFDPRLHDALALVPVTDPAQDGRVVDVMREGYLIGEDTLRPAGVAVGKHSK